MKMENNFIDSISEDGIGWFSGESRDSSPNALADGIAKEKYDTTINHTRMEDMVFRDKKTLIDEMYEGEESLQYIEENGTQKLSSFKGITQDTFNLFYKIRASERESDELSEKAAVFNKKIIEKAKANPDFGALKLITEGKDFESIDAAREFSNNIYKNLDDLLTEIAGDPGTLDKMEKISNLVEQKQGELDVKRRMLSAASESEKPGIQKSIASLEKMVEANNKKLDKYRELNDARSVNNDKVIEDKVNKAIKDTLFHVNQTTDILETWGTSDGKPKTIEGKTSLIKKVRKDKKFAKIAIELGKMKRITKSKLNKRFDKGLGQKMGIEYGNSLKKVLPSEIAMLGTPETKTLFFKRFVEKGLKQYKEGEEVHEGRGHVIFLVDESSSTDGERSIWSKALAIALMDIAVRDYRNFAYIPFSTAVGNIQHINYENYSEDAVAEIANSFIGGGTNFTEPIKIATKLLEENRYTNADVVFVTDGHATIDSDVLSEFLKQKEAKKAKCAGILLDTGGYGTVSDTTIKSFCDVIYKTSELGSDGVADAVIGGVL